MNFFTHTLYATLMLFLAACVWVPPVWDLSDEINNLEGIVIGHTTKTDILEKFGEPNFKRGDPEMFIYSGEKSLGFLVAGSYKRSGAGLIGEEYWTVYIDFDAHDVVSDIWKSGDPRAQFSMYHRSNSSDERWKWLCLSANNGHALAQEEMGELHLISRKQFWHWQLEGYVEPNKISAYVWYKLAVYNGSKRAEHFIDQISEEITEQELAEGERKFAVWKPASDECRA